VIAIGVDFGGHALGVRLQPDAVGKAVAVGNGVHGVSVHEKRGVVLLCAARVFESW
jgi:hypothetical protein